MATIGQMLREARARKGATIAEAAAVTQVKASTLDAMERDDFSRMPAAVYAKGFLRIYGRFLNIDPEPLVREYVLRHTAEAQARAAADLVAARAAGLPPPEATPRRIPDAAPAAAPQAAPPATPPAPPAAAPPKPEPPRRPRLRMPQIPVDRALPIARAVAVAAVAVLLVYGLSQCVRSCSRRRAAADRPAEAPREALRLPPELMLVEPPPDPYLGAPAAP
jgi:transcriptional regulator with XRE-family HTH domain